MSDESVGTATDFDGRCGELRGLKPSPWLASEDIDGLGDVPAIIEKIVICKNAVFEGGRKENVSAVVFAGKSRWLVLNATNRKTLRAAFGNDVSKWKGQRVVLFCVDTMIARTPCRGIRVKVARQGKR